MSFNCDYKNMCEAAALFDEATIVALLPDETTTALYGESAARIVMLAAFDTMADLGDEGLAQFREDLPDESSRCSDCYLTRNDLLRTLLEEVPDTPASLE